GHREYGKNLRCRNVAFSAHSGPRRAGSGGRRASRNSPSLTAHAGDPSLSGSGKTGSPSTSGGIHSLLISWTSSKKSGCALFRSFGTGLSFTLSQSSLRGQRRVITTGARSSIYG